MVVLILIWSTSLSEAFWKIEPQFPAILTAPTGPVCRNLRSPICHGRWRGKTCACFRIEIFFRIHKFNRTAVFPCLEGNTAVFYCLFLHLFPHRLGSYVMKRSVSVKFILTIAKSKEQNNRPLVESSLKTIFFFLSIFRIYTKGSCCFAKAKFSAESHLFC